jgi:hypothetical protein
MASPGPITSKPGPDHFAHAMNYCYLALQLRGGPLQFQVTLPQDGMLRW